MMYQQTVQVFINCTEVGTYADKQYDIAGLVPRPSLMDYSFL